LITDNYIIILKKPFNTCINLIIAGFFLLIGTFKERELIIIYLVTNETLIVLSLYTYKNGWKRTVIKLQKNIITFKSFLF
jgi:hypothetical protein